MTQHLSILTGASRGLGLALANQLLARGHRVVALSRRPAELSVPAGAELLNWPVDLADAAPAAARLRAWLSVQDGRRVASATLINNAGVISDLAPLSEGESGDLAQALRVGLEAPMLLTAAFLHATSGWAAPRKVVFVSSGLGRRAMAGSASYCAAKAGLDHLARAVALEEAAKIGGARVVSLAPGVIDTDMQVQLRSADPARFGERARFEALHSQGQLDTSAQAAAKLLAYLDRADFGENPVADVRDPPAARD
jgi:NAD(P)-dependent dehydrogenase (short-subunit alcohol dehydrogenase family)